MIRPDMIEAQLAHYMEYRKAMMQFWTDTLNAMQTGKNLPKWAGYEPHGKPYLLV